ncbi:hypothetical protein ACROYT_G015582 [Oculina patagonica]
MTLTGLHSSNSTSVNLVCHHVCRLRIHVQCEIELHDQKSVVGHETTWVSTTTSTNSRHILVGPGTSSASNSSLAGTRLDLVGPGTSSVSNSSLASTRLDLVGPGTSSVSNTSLANTGLDLVGPGTSSASNTSSANTRLALVGLRTRQCELALAYFDGGKDGTCSREMIPKTCPLVMTNWEALKGLPQDYRIASRLAMIPFVVGPRSPDGLDAQQQAEENLKVAMTDAPRALGALISINIYNVMRRSKEIKSKCLAEDFPDINNRVSENYALLLSMTEELIDLVNDKDLVNTDMLEEYFEDIMYPTCIKRFQMKTGQNGPAGCEDEGPLIASLIMDAIDCESLTRGKLTPVHERDCRRALAIIEKKEDALLVSASMSFEKDEEKQRQWKRINIKRLRAHANRL